MKTLAMILMTFLTVHAQASDKTVCYEIETKSATKVQVVIETLKDITNSVSYGRHYDSITKVKVTVNEITRGRKTEIKSFLAIARKADVQYNISSVKKDGFLFWQFLDEEDQDGVRLSTRSGKKVSHRLHCDY